MPKKIVFILCCIGIVSFFLSVYQRKPTPPCLNADEAAFSYNAYSILKTGRDEYGALLPLRLKSFGDNKLPLFTYLSVPFIAVFGLNEWGARAPNAFLSLLFPFVVYLFTQELFGRKKVSLLAALLSALSLGLHIMTRQAHEGYLAVFLTTTSALLLLRTLKKPSFLHLVLFILSTACMLFAYHPGRLFAGLFLIYACVFSFVAKRRSSGVIAILVLVIGLFSLTDIAYKPERPASLFFFNNPGTALKVQELKTEGGIRYLYNPILVGLKDIVAEHLSYYSPQFLIANGDENTRFGYPGMGIVTPVEYVLFFAGCYFLFRKKEKSRYFVSLLLLFAPLSASLSWSKGSLTRSLFLLVPVLVTASYGAASLWESMRPGTGKKIALAGVMGLFLLFQAFSWDFYLFHYSKRLITIHSWQCGYAKVADFVKQNYDSYDTFYVSKSIGQPYIFMLFYLKYDPATYQKQASLSKTDQYGFGQVDRFDKFIFEFPDPATKRPKTAIIGSVDDFKGAKYQPVSETLKTVDVNGEPMFRILP